MAARRRVKPSQNGGNLRPAQLLRRCDRWIAAVKEGAVHFGFFTALFAGVIVAVPASAADDALIVYIECQSQSDPSSVVIGSGVVVTAEGHVLTAKHVAKDGFTCRGAISSRTNPLRSLIPTPYTLDEVFDGRILRFHSPGNDFAHARLCRATPALIGKRLEAIAFHRQSLGEPSLTSGVLSTSIPSEYGMLETDAMTVFGKSGGPVFLENSNDLVGIVAGVQFDALGAPISYQILAAEIFARPLGPVGLVALSDTCGVDDDTSGHADAGTTLAPLSSKSAHYWTYPASSQWRSESVTQSGYRVGVSHTEDLPPAGESLAIFSYDIRQFAGTSISRAELDLTPTDVIGDPYRTLGVLQVEQISIGDLSQSIMASAMDHNHYLTAPPRGPLDITHAVRSSIERGASSVQFRLRFSAARLSNINDALAASDAFLKWDYGPKLTIQGDD